MVALITRNRDLQTFHASLFTEFFKNVVLIEKECWAKREEVAGDWIRLHNGELHNLYTSPNIIRVIKSRRMRLTGTKHAREIWEIHTAFSLENL